jgi:hypothetical protein
MIDEYIKVPRRLELKNEKEIGDLLSLFAHGFNVVFTAKTPSKIAYCGKRP